MLKILRNIINEDKFVCFSYKEFPVKFKKKHKNEENLCHSYFL